MRIVFDAHWWAEGPTSVRHVLREIVLSWAATFPDDTVALVVRHRDLARVRNDVPAHAVLAASRLTPQALLASFGTERVRRRLGFDAIVTHNFAARSRGISAVYLHDVLFQTNPEWFTPKERGYFSFMVRWIRKADIVFSSSAAEGDRIRSTTPARHVVPVGLGISHELIDSPLREPVEGLEPGRFLLSVGRLNVRKNLERTVHAALDSGEATPTHPLVIVGAGDDETLRAHPRIRDATATGAVRFTGHVSDAQLRWLYEHTRLFLFLSLGEGFGMPPIEARHFGAPVLASDLPVMRENLGDEAGYVDPSDDAAIAAAIRAELARPVAVRAPSTLADQHAWSATVRAMRAALHAASR